MCMCTLKKCNGHLIKSTILDTDLILWTLMSDRERSLLISGSKGQSLSQWLLEIVLYVVVLSLVERWKVGGGWS